MTEIISGVTQFELNILLFINRQLTSAFGDWLVKAITLISDNGLIWIALGIILLLFPKHRMTGLKLLLGLAVFHLVCNCGLKLLFARERPFAFLPEIELLISPPADYSFPSGHTMSSFMCAAILLHDKKAWGIAAFVLAALIAASRLYLLVHFPSDVLAGLLLGIMLGWLVGKIGDIARRGCKDTK